MLLRFTVENFLSFKNRVVFSMNSASEKEESASSFAIRNYRLLHCAAVYGPNASGKSSFIKAIAFMRHMVLNRHKITQSTDLLPHHPFLLSRTTENNASFFEIVFFQENIKYRYGFEADKREVYAEWLFADEKGKEAQLFYRDKDEDEKLYVNPERFKEGLGIKEKVLPNHLFLWKCDQENGSVSRSILNWFGSIRVLDGFDEAGIQHESSMQKITNPSFGPRMLDLLKKADMGIENLAAESEPLPDAVISKMPFSDELKQELRQKGIPKISTQHTVYDADGNKDGKATFDMFADESRGTRKFFTLSAPVIETLSEGHVLVVDELDAGLHPLLTRHLIDLFQNPEVNAHNAQLVFATHDTNLLSTTLKREQVWLSEKDTFSSTTLYSLLDIKGVTSREDLEKKYMQGRYGAIPFLGNFDQIEIGNDGTHPKA